MRTFLCVSLACLCVLNAGCGSKRPLVVNKISEVRPDDPAGLELLPVSISKRSFQRVLSLSELNQHIRIVELVSSASGIRSPLLEYRLFDIRKGSVYDTIGLRNADVIVAANGFVIQRPTQLLEIIAGISNTPEQSSMEIRRAGKPVRIVYNFTE